MKPLYPVKSDYLIDTDALVASDTIYSGLLVASTEQTVTVPTGADFAIFTADADFYANYDTTAAVPTGTISQTGGELIPEIRYIGDVTAIHLIAPSTCKISIAFYGK
jgi:hypothetical protein